MSTEIYCLAFLLSQFTSWQVLIIEMNALKEVRVLLFIFLVSSWFLIDFWFYNSEQSSHHKKEGNKNSFLIPDGFFTQRMTCLLILFIKSLNYPVHLYLYKKFISFHGLSWKKCSFFKFLLDQDQEQDAWDVLLVFLFALNVLLNWFLFRLSMFLVFWSSSHLWPQIVGLCFAL